MKLSSRFSLALLSLSLGAFIMSCAEREFKGGIKKGALSTPKETRDVLPVAPVGSNPTEEIDIPDPAPQDPEIVTDTPLVSTETILEHVVSKLPDSLRETFKASQTLSEEFQFSLDLGAGSTDFKLVDTFKTQVDSRKQITRSSVTDSFDQGTAGQPKTETFLQDGKKGLVDILVVIDDSGSMTEEQTNLASKMNALLTSLIDTNWRIGVITTTVAADKCNLTLIKSDEADASTKFARAVTAGTGGSGNEEGIRQAVNGLKCTEHPWVRGDSTVAVLIVSDEDNCSLDGKDCPTSPAKTEVFLEDFMEKTLGREIGKTAGFYGIFSPPANPCKTAGNKAPQYQRLMEFKTGVNSTKKFGNICDADYSATLKGISSDIALLLKHQFELAQVPDANTLVLTVDGVVIPPSDYQLSSKTVTFVIGKEPANGKTLIANYKIGVKPLFNKVTLKNDPVPESIAVKIGGTVLAASAYTVTGRDIKFATQPPDLATITVDYRIFAPLLNTFSLDNLPLVDSLLVLVNGTAAAGMTYDAANNRVVINPAPVDGANIEIKYNFRVGPQLTYRVAVPQGASNVKVFDGSKELAFSVSGDAFTIPAADHRVGAILSLKYDLPLNTSRIFTLPHTPDAGTALFKKDTEGCRLNEGITITANSLEANCTVNAKTDFLVEYTYTEKQKVFTLNVPDPDKGRWEVLIDGVVTTEYTVVGSTISLDNDPKSDATIEIRFSLPEK